MCGIFGVYGSENAAVLTWLGLHGIQHRGQESAGIVTFDGRSTYFKKGLGTAALAIKSEELDLLKGHIAVGHVRYSTVSDSSLENCQPFDKILNGNPFVIAHNGNISDLSSLESLVKDRLFSTDVDTEYIMHVIANSDGIDFREKVVNGLRKVPPSYALVMFYDNMLIAARDPCGYRPLSLGITQQGAHLVASESCAFDINEADFVRDIEPGEILFIDRNGFDKRIIEKRERLGQCIFELVYFARPDSKVFGYCVSRVKKNLGRQLARESSTEADIVIPIPDAANHAALGYSYESKILFDIGLVRSHYVGRTFIQPGSELREFGAKLKFNPDSDIIEGKRVIVVDDSIVRGNNASKVVGMLRRKGAREVHVKVTFPPWERHCDKGIDTKEDHELIANMYDMEGIRKKIGCDTVQYLSLEGLMKSIPNSENKFCIHCTGH